MVGATQKTITAQEAAYFVGIEHTRFRNLAKRGDFADITQTVPSLYGKKVQIIIKPAAFLEKYALTWEDIFEARKILSESKLDKTI